jgi:hypothetical protein
VPITAVVAIDWSLSYPVELRQAALHELSVQVASLPRYGQGPTRIVIRAITENSYGDSASLHVVELDSIPTRPPEPAGDRLDGGKAERAWEEQVRQIQALLGKARQDAKADAEIISKLRRPVATRSDIEGALQRASEILEGVDGQRFFIYVSDLARAGRQQWASSHRLDGVDVLVAFFHCDEAAACERRRDEWHALFMRNGAASATFFAPDEPVEFFQVERTG